MARPKKELDNKIVSDWLIEHRWLKSLDATTKLKLPAFVDDAVWAALYVVAGSSNSGRLNVSPKLVMKCLMLRTLTTETVKVMEVGYEMSDRQAQRLAKTTRFALDGIKHRIQEYENSISEDQKVDWRFEKQFVSDYYSGKESTLYSAPLPVVPDEILQLNKEGKYVEYGEALMKFRQGS